MNGAIFHGSRLLCHVPFTRPYCPVLTSLSFFTQCCTVQYWDGRPNPNFPTSNTPSHSTHSPILLAYFYFIPFLFYYFLLCVRAQEEGGEIWLGK